MQRRHSYAIVTLCTCVCKVFISIMANVFVSGMDQAYAPIRLASYTDEDPLGNNLPA